MNRTITLQGNPLTLLGNDIKQGDKAPQFTVVNGEMKPVTLSSYAGKVLIITSVPSLDTDVCDRETRKFNEEASKLGTDVRVLTISMDLPFAQKRWCGSAGIKNIDVLSDYQSASFGNSYGVLIKDLRLLARAVFVVDKKGIVQYVELVSEVANEPNYGAALNAARELTKA